MVIGMGDDPIEVCRARIADAGAGVRHSRGSNATFIKWVKAADSRLINTDPGIVEDCDECLHVERLLAPAPNEAAMGASDDNLTNILSLHKRRRINTDNSWAAL